jgi:hypothetical protein
MRSNLVSVIFRATVSNGFKGARTSHRCPVLFLAQRHRDFFGFDAFVLCRDGIVQRALPVCANANVLDIQTCYNRSKGGS